MTETILDSATVTSGGGTKSGTVGKSPDSDVLTLVVTEHDSNSTNLDFDAVKAAPTSSDTVRTFSGGSTTSGVDASNDGAVVVLTGLEGVGHVDVQVTNNASSDTTITVVEDTPT